jgi:hypothetical protein
MTTARKMISIAVVLAALVIGGTANAELSRGVITAFKGQLVISKTDLPEGKNDKDTISKIKAAKVSELTGEAQEDVTYWNFHYTAFLSKAGSSTLKLEFYKDGKQFVADKTLDGVDAKSSVLTGDISINEDEGLTKGKAYVVKLVAGKNTVVATANLLMK